MIRDVPGLPATRPAPPGSDGPAAEPATLEPPAVAVPVFNPRLRLDPELNLVVLEFRTGTGELRDSIPSPRELDAYRREQASGAATRAVDVKR